MMKQLLGICIVWFGIFGIIGGVVAKDVAYFPIVVTKEPEYAEFCDGVSVGQDAFAIHNGYRDSLSVGDVYSTTTGKLIEIVGKANSLNYYELEEINIFKVAPQELPDPKFGQRGPFYNLHTNGQVIYADWVR